MALKDLQEKLKGLVTEGETIAAKAELSQPDMERLQVISVEGKALRGQMEALAAAGDLSSWARQSAGMLPVSSPASVIGTRDAGTATLDIRNDKGVKSVLVNDEGEMLVSEQMLKTLRDPEYSKAFRSYLRGGVHNLKATELKILQEGADVSGGFTVPEDILNRLITREPAPRTIQNKVTRLNTSRDAINVPTVTYTTDNQYTSGMRVTWTGEVPASASSHNVTDPTFGQVHIPIYTAMMSLPLTNDLIEDSSVGIINWASSKFEETIELLYENMILNGTGAAQPTGILVDTNLTTVASGAASTLTWNGIHDLIYALPEQYDRNAVVVMNKTNTALALSKLLDGNGRPYWTNGDGDYGLAGERVNRPLLGYPLVFNAFMPNVAASAEPILFGDLSGYYLINRIGFSIQVLRELYAETNQVLLLGRIRFGGKPVEFWRWRAQTIST